MRTILFVKCTYCVVYVCVYWLMQMLTTLHVFSGDEILIGHFCPIDITVAHLSGKCVPLGVIL